MILSLENVSFKYVIEPILDNQSFVVNEKDKWGVVGVNGSGKSTLLALMAGKEKPDTGNVNRLNKYTISYCPQHMEFEKGLTIYEAVLKNIDSKTETFRIKSILNKLGFDDYDLKVDNLSGGQCKRIALAISLIIDADLYLLDEPTNHLDQDMILWLENYLIKTNKAIVMVTHDRYFLSRITNHIVEIDRGHLYAYEGTYADYLVNKEIRYEQMMSEQQKRKSFLRTEIEWIRAGAQARSTKQKARIEHFNKLAAIEDIREKDTLELHSASSYLGRKIIEINNVSKSYGDKTLFTDFSYNVLRNDRIGIIGDNGCGKSTLLKVILKQIKPDTGDVEIGETVKIGYFSQLNEVFEKDMKVIDYLKQFGEIIYTADGDPITASKMLERFLFFKEAQYKPLSKCSGGEKRRLYLCSILMQSPNVLLLDEPTNDLDTETLSILEDYLDDFKGAVLVVSHDRYFLDKVCDHLFVFENGTVTLHNEDYSTYLENRIKDETTSSVKEEKVTVTHTSNKLSYKEKRELEDLTKEIEEYDNAIPELEEKLNSLTDYKEIEEVSNKLNSMKEEYENILERWMELSEKE